MVVDVGYRSGREASCLHCGEPLFQTEWSWGMTWNHEDGNPYCADAPQGEPAPENTESPYLHDHDWERWDSMGDDGLQCSICGANRETPESADHEAGCECIDLRDPCAGPPGNPPSPPAPRQYTECGHPDDVRSMDGRTCLYCNYPPENAECSCRGTMRREGAEHGPYLCSQPPVHTDEDCACNPTTKPVPQDDGSIDWLIVHKEMS